MKVFAILLSILFMVSSTGASTAVPPHCFDEWAGSVEVDERLTDTPLAEFENLRPGMRRAAVIERVGEPSLLCGAGVSYDVYVLPDQREIWNRYHDDLSVWAFVVDAQGNNQKLVFGVRPDAQ